MRKLTDDSNDLEVSRPRYKVISEQIAGAIKQGLLPAGTVLTEDPIAKAFDSSRTPVRTALGALNKQGHLARFEGRGYLVTDPEIDAADLEPIRVTITRDMLGLTDDSEDEAFLSTSERVAREFEDELIHALPFGKYQINEQAAADQFQVSRTVIRDILSRQLSRGIVRKDQRSHWVIGPLTATEIGHYYSIRAKLEPLALRDSAPHVDEDTLVQMMQRVKAAQENPEQVSIDTMNTLEHDLHWTLLSKSGNPHLLRMVQQSQLALVVNHVFSTFVGTRPFENTWDEHALILKFVKRGSYSLAAQALEEHLRQAADRTSRRLMAISVFPKPERKPYLKRIDT